jgi:hypothetical protein
MHFYLRLSCLLIVFYYCGFMNLSAQDYTARSSKDTIKGSSRFNLGVYAGLTNAFTLKGTGINLSPSFLCYGQIEFNEKWQVDIGFGQSGYSGKSLNYNELKDVYDTLELKKNTIEGITYLTVPIILKYNISKKSQVMAGIRVSFAEFLQGIGTYSIAMAPKKDSFIYMSNLIPQLPSQVNNMDFGGIIGFEYGFNRHLKASIQLNVGFIPIFPQGFNEAVGERIGNYNVSAEVGVHYLFYSYINKKD